MTELGFTLDPANYNVLLEETDDNGALDPANPMVEMTLRCHGVPATDENRALLVATFAGIRSSRLSADSLKALEEQASKLALSQKTLLALATAADAYIAEHGEEGQSVKFSLSFNTTTDEETGEESYASASVKLSLSSARAKKGGKKSSKSRKSAFQAWKETKGKDSFKLESVQETGDDGKKKTVGYKDTSVSPPRFVKRGELTKYIGKVYPNSLTAATLKEYGQL